MELTWTDADGVEWRVRAFFGQAMATNGSIPDAGQPLLTFIPTEGNSLSIPNPDFRNPEDMTDAELQAALEQARARWARSI